MKPRLIILNGSLESQTFTLQDGEVFTIGRALRNQLTIPDTVMSREHALIRKTAEGYLLEDLNSQNGIYVNDYSAQKSLLTHGDRIRIGQTNLLFLTEDDEALTFSNEIHFDEDLTATQSDFVVPFRKLSDTLPTDLDVLTKIGAALNEIQNSEELQKKLLEIILEIIPAERGAIILLNNDLISPNSVCVMNKVKRGTEPMHISRSVTQRVFSEKSALLRNDINNTEFHSTDSLINMGVNSLLCVPLLSGEISGLIYLDSGDAKFCFETEHLQQMTAIGSLVVSALKNVRHLESLKIENQSLQNWVEIETNMIGESEPMKTLAQLIAKVSQTDSTILISGESGTGKELVARAIHKNSLRNNKPFIALNCAVLNENFLDSDLFGHEKGAFTGAAGQRKGKIEIADGGTLFLDEIGELAPTLQAKLLRVIQEREFE
ncbi:MAG: sigma 54-interacting transcriptional regulator, partial [Acidobacteriota bacterium]